MHHLLAPLILAMVLLAPAVASPPPMGNGELINRGANAAGTARTSEPHPCRNQTDCARLADGLPPAPTPLANSPTSPPVSNLPVAPASATSFAVRVSNSWCLPVIAGNSIANTLHPDLSGLADLSALANLGGFDHFNIEQEITDISGDRSPALLPRWTGVDPALGGNTFSQFDDQYPWYYDEVPISGQWMPLYDDPRIFDSNSDGESVGLDWRDAPNLGPTNAGVTLTFVDYLVGVYADHTGARISDMFPGAQNVNFTWSFTQGDWGGSARELLRFVSFDQSEPGSDGSVLLLDFFGSDPTKLSSSPGNSCRPSRPPRRTHHPQVSVRISH